MGQALQPAARAQPQQRQPHPPSPLPRDLLLHVLSFLPPNVLALGGRLACKDAAQHFPAPQHATVRLGLPLPPHAVGTWQAAGREAMRQLPFRRKLRLLSTAAASGCEANLEVAWALLKPCLFPDLLPNFYTAVCVKGLGSDPGTAAASAGHAHVLPWLVSRRCPVDLESTLAAAARHCNLEGLQDTWRLLYGLNRQLKLSNEVLDAAAESLTADAMLKIQWLLLGAAEGAHQEAQQQHKHGKTRRTECKEPQPLQRDTRSCSVTASTIAAAARSGDVARVEWLWRQYGGAVDPACVLGAALRHGHLAVAEWLLDSGVCRLRPRMRQHGGGGGGVAGAQGMEDSAELGEGEVDVVSEEGEEEGLWSSLCQAAGQHGSVDAMRWLLQRGAGTGAGAVPDAAGVPHSAVGPAAPARGEQPGGHGVGPGAAGGGRWQVRPPHSSALAHALTHGHLQLVQYLLHSCGMQLHPNTMRAAAGSGSVRLVELLLPLLPRTPDGTGLLAVGLDPYTSAAATSDVPMLRWLVQRARYPWPDGGTAVDAVTRVLWYWCRTNAQADRECMQAVRVLLEAAAGDGPGGGGAAGADGGCAGSAGRKAVELAASRGSLEVVRVLVEEAGCGLSWGVWVAAADSGCVSLLEWLAEREGAGEGAGEQSLYELAGRRGDLETLECLWRLGVPMGSDVLVGAVAAGCPLAVVQWLVARGAGADVAGARAALREVRRSHVCKAGQGQREGEGRMGEGPRMAMWLEELVRRAGEGEGVGKARMRWLVGVGRAAVGAGLAAGVVVGVMCRIRRQVGGRA